MSANSRKKKSVTARCDACGGYFLAHAATSSTTTRTAPRSSTRAADTSIQSDATTTPKMALRRGARGSSLSCGSSADANEPNAICSHQDVWNSKSLESVVQCVLPLCGAFLLPHVFEPLPKQPAELLGWKREHVTYLNPEAITQLGVLPHSPLLVESFGNDDPPVDDVFVVWPNKDVPQLRIGFRRKLPAESLAKCVRVSVVCPRQLGALTLSLTLVDNALPGEFGRRLSRVDSFIYYLRAYLANAFLVPDALIIVQYYVKRLTFRVVEARFLDDVRGVAKEELDGSMGGEKGLIQTFDALHISAVPSHTTREVMQVTTETDIRLQWQLEERDDEKEEIR